MILLTKIDLVNNCTEEPSQHIHNEEFIGIDAWSVITVEKLHYNGGIEGSKVFLAEGRGFITVREFMTDVIHMVEIAVRPEEVDDV